MLAAPPTSATDVLLKLAARTMYFDHPFPDSCGLGDIRSQIEAFAL